MSDAIELAGRLREWGSIRCCAEAADMIEQQAARIAELEGTIKRQASAARAGMDAAKRVSTIQFQEASRLRAESSPDVLASERQANALLTDENERLTARIAELEARIAQRTENSPACDCGGADVEIGKFPQVGGEDAESAPAQRTNV